MNDHFKRIYDDNIDLQLQLADCNRGYTLMTWVAFAGWAMALAALWVTV